MAEISNIAENVLYVVLQCIEKMDDNPGFQFAKDNVLSGVFIMTIDEYACQCEHLRENSLNSEELMMIHSKWGELKRTMSHKYMYTEIETINVKCLQDRNMIYKVVKDYFDQNYFLWPYRAIYMAMQAFDREAHRAREIDAGLYNGEELKRTLQ